MTRVKILLVAMSVLTLFIICGGCERHERRDDDGQRYRQLERERMEQQSDRDRSDRDRDKNSDSHEERHEERH